MISNTLENVLERQSRIPLLDGQDLCFSRFSILCFHSLAQVGFLLRSPLLRRNAPAEPVFPSLMGQIVQNATIFPIYRAGTIVT